MHEEENSVQKSFFPVLLLLHAIGMETLPIGKRLEQTHFERILWNVPKYLIGFLHFFLITFQSVNTLLVPDRKISISVLLVMLSQAFLNFRAYRSRKHFLIIVNKISNTSSLFSSVDKSRNLMTSVTVYCVLMILLLMSYGILLLYSSGYTFLQNGRDESEFMSKKLKEHFSILFHISVIIATAVSSLVFTSISVYYGLVSIYFSTLCGRLKLQVQNVKDSWDCGRVIYVYLKIREIVESLEHFMCSLAFVIVVSTMTGLFHMGYSMIFISKDGCIDYLCYLGGGLFHFSIIGTVLVSGSSANTGAEGAKEAVMSLPGIFPKWYNELKAILRKDCKQKPCLTLWKIYKIDRSLIITAMGVLMNYGILIATLGTVSRCNEKI
ncbi:uncharacterized protein NPIL_668931 [Nephila pilipes]|uniref:Gustatory receptor n=1 Tax=Nephila pilipes TaxID=299642 RepID=A0A8X6TQI0_NEPPI|nr:uncharacterized protein NPIL_668931 [Nephila pilipes]